MGSTHYWRRPTELPAESFRSAVDDARCLLSVRLNEVAGFDGTGLPNIAEDRIVFNGRSPLACEPLEIAAVEFSRQGSSNVRSFCKTDHLPYDLFVKAVLIVFHHRLTPDFIVSSDEKDDDWATAREVVKYSLGYGECFRLSI